MSAIRVGTTTLLFAGIAGACSGLFAQAQSSVPRVTRLGSHKAYGPGIVAASLGEVRFEVTRAAHVVVLRVHPDGSIEPLLPQRADAPTERAAGTHVIEAPPPAAVPDPGADRPLDARLSRGALERAGRPVRPPAAGPDATEPSTTAYWWLVLVSDVPTGVGELQARLESFRTRTFTSVQASVKALPRELVAQRPQTWAAYFAPVEP